MVGRYFSPLGASDAATHTCQRLYDAAAATAAAKAQAGAEEEAAAKEAAAARAQAAAAAAEDASSAAQCDGEEEEEEADGANLVPKPLRQWVHRFASLTVATALSALELSPTPPPPQSLTPLPKPAPKQHKQSARWQAADSRFFWNKRVFFFLRLLSQSIAISPYFVHILYLPTSGSISMRIVQLRRLLLFSKF